MVIIYYIKITPHDKDKSQVSRFGAILLKIPIIRMSGRQPGQTNFSTGQIQKPLTVLGVHRIVICRIPDSRIIPDNFLPDSKPDTGYPVENA